MHTLIRELFWERGVEEVGFCGLPAAGPLMEGRAADRIPSGAQSVIVALFPFHTGEYPHRNVARYAVPDDYHGIAGEILRQVGRALEQRFPGEAFAPFTDISPIREVEAARLAGLGDVGKNGLLISRAYGPRVFVGEIVTTLALPSDRAPGGSCTGCGACVRACPTGALSEDGFCPGRCRSHITQKKGALSRWEEEEIRKGGFVWGCDICLDACPASRGRPPTPIAAFYRNPAPVVTRENLDGLYPDKAWNWRRKPVLLRNLRILGGGADG